MTFSKSTILVPLISASSVVAGNVKTIEFTWEDINSRDVVRWEGDTAIVAPSSTTTELSCTTRIDVRDVDAAVANFGIPTSWTSFTYRGDDDLAKKQAELKKKAARHGLHMGEDNMFSIDYQWIIDQSTRHLRDTAKNIRSTARRNGYRSRRDIVGAFASFVQALEYRMPPDKRVASDGKPMMTIGAMVPLEVLSEQWGDCDSKSMLFASLVKSINLVDVLFIIKDEHLFAAVDVPNTQDDQTIGYRGKDWVLIELTDAWPVGRVPEKHLESISKNAFTIIELD